MAIKTNMGWMKLRTIASFAICVIVGTILFYGLNLQQVDALDDEKDEYEKKRMVLEKMRAEKKDEYEKMRAEKIAEFKKKAELEKRLEKIAEFEKKIASIENAELEQKRSQFEKKVAEKNAELEKRVEENTDVSVTLESLPYVAGSDEKTQNEKRIQIEQQREQLKKEYARSVTDGTKERGDYGRARIQSIYDELMTEKQRVESSSSTNLPDNIWGPIQIGRYVDPEDHHGDTDNYMINGEALVGDHLYIYKNYVFVGRLDPSVSIAVNCQIVDSKGIVLYETNYPPHKGEFTDTSYLFSMECGNFTPTKPDTYKIVSTFDASNTLEENDESNNVSIDTFVVY